MPFSTVLKLISLGALQPNTIQSLVECGVVVGGRNNVGRSCTSLMRIAVMTLLITFFSYFFLDDDDVGGGEWWGRNR